MSTNKPSMIMNGGSAVNWGRSLRRPIPDRPATPGDKKVDVGDLDVDALLADGDEARYQRQWVESFRGDAAKPALNALQKWMFEHNSPTQDWKRWRLAYNVMTRLSGNSDQLPRQTIIEWVDLSTAELVTSGTFGDVFKGVCAGMPVAIKRLQLGESSDPESTGNYRRFRREALIWFQLRHPNILELKGIFEQVANFSKYPCMISPWVDGGTITEYIKKPEYDPRQQRIPLLIEVAQGLDYVHQRGVYHGDLHDGNILIDQGRAVLTDFGMTVVGDKSRSAIPTTDLPAHAIRWIAPELVSDDDYVPRRTWEGDMFGFGRLCLAICTRGVLFKNMNDINVASCLARKQNPTRPTSEECDSAGISEQLWALAEDCWKFPPHTRPSAAQALERLQAR